MISRRSFLTSAAVVASVLRLRASAPAETKPRSVIMVCLAGGPSHLETYDLKPDAPTEYRGEFKPIRSNVPGFDLCELFPLQSRIADKLSLVRSLQFVEPMQHELEEVYTGFPRAGKRPSFAAVVSRFRPGDPRIPSNVSLEYGNTTRSYEEPLYVGEAHRPLQVSGTEGVRNLGLHWQVKPARLGDRKAMLAAFDSFKREAEGMKADAHTSRALDIITSARARQAFDLEREPARVREMYGHKDDKYIYVGHKADTPWDGKKFLLARRLVEAGVPVVTLRAGSWDHHGNVLQGGTIWKSLRTALPLLDRSIHALVTDLHQRGLDKEVLVLVWGEFGRTPRTYMNGRDHWPDASFALMAGAVRGGQVIGETDSKGERPRKRPLGPQNVLATVYHALGIDPTIKLNDFTGRPQPLLDDGEPIRDLLL
ncbi:MAG: DUF1501 domain-containing protein [Gemmataceae bacterium]|nr:DUF1501 domain-containing protein [Gemmataceae bacterium]